MLWMLLDFAVEVIRSYCLIVLPVAVASLSAFELWLTTRLLSRRAL